MAECSVKIRDIIYIENVSKLFDEQILIFKSMKYVLVFYIHIFSCCVTCVLSVFH